MKDCIKGSYYKSEDQIEAIRNFSDRLILNNLRNSFPNAKSVGRLEDDFEEETNIVQSTIYSAIRKFEEHHFIHRLSIRQKKEASSGFLISKENNNNKGPDKRTEFYIIEEADNAMHLLSRHPDSQWRKPGYSLAPGYVDYDEEFLNKWNTLLGERLIDKEVLNDLSGKILLVLKSIFSVIIGEDDTKHCINCGINHEARNLVRALLLKILDHVELSPDYIEFLREKNIINELGFDNYDEARKYNEKVIYAFSKPGDEHAKQKLRIIAMSEGRFLALTKTGSYIIGEGKIENMDVNDLLEYRKPLPTTKGSEGLPVIRVNDKVAKKLPPDRSIPGRETLSITRISNIKKDLECYHIRATVVSKDEKVLDIYSTKPYVGILILQDTFSSNIAGPRIEYHTFNPLTNIVYKNLEVGDRIDAIGVCRIDESRSGSHKQRKIWLHDPEGIPTIELPIW